MILTTQMGRKQAHTQTHTHAHTHTYTNTHIEPPTYLKGLFMKPGTLTPFVRARTHIRT